MERPLDFEFVDQMLYKITYFWPNRAKADAFPAVMRYQKSETFEKWHYTFSHPMEWRDDGTVHTTAGECGIRPEEVVKIEPVSDDERRQWQDAAREFMDWILRESKSDPCHEDVSDVAAYQGPAVVFQ